MLIIIVYLSCRLRSADNLPSSVAYRAILFRIHRQPFVFPSSHAARTSRRIGCHMVCPQFAQFSHRAPTAQPRFPSTEAVTVYAGIKPMLFRLHEPPPCAAPAQLTSLSRESHIAHVAFGFVG